MRLNRSHIPWPLLAWKCSCDVHFVEYLDEREVRGKTLFHFGTGLHHLVGRENALRPPADRNEILGITASPQEYKAYIDLVCKEAEVGLSYKVLFGDIYTLSPRLLPRFDLVTLFHLCEFYDPVRSRYAPLDDAALLDLFLDRLSPGGRILFYTGSRAFSQAGPLIEERVRDGRIEPVDEHKELAVYALAHV